jgi:lipopolysaccharide/colanic/teichoic acid biosynthesis glycosyltransferase
MERGSTALVVAPRAGPWMAAKRVIDVIGSAVGLVALSPLLLLLAIAVVVDSGRPVLFRQVRLARGMREFRVLKFRTMKLGATPEMHREYITKLASGDADEDSLKKLTGDPRVTRVGRFLRKTSLDELPQLVNVFIGNMSLVGPRPALEYELEHYHERHFQRFAVKPGMTGLWQVSGRSELDFDELVRLDFLYLERWSVFLDLSILLKTIPAVVRARGAW